MLRKLLIKCNNDGQVEYFDAETNEQLTNVMGVSTGIAADDLVTEVQVLYTLDEIKMLNLN